MTRCVLLLLVFFVQTSLAQTNLYRQRVDSLHSELKRSVSDTTSIALYHLLANESFERNAERGLAYEDSALVLAKQLRDPKSIATALTNIGTFYNQISEYRKAYALLQEAIKISPPSAKWLGETYIESGNSMLRTSHLDSAMHFFTLGLNHVKKFPNPYLEASLYNMVGNVRRDQNNYEEALNQYIKAVKLFEQQKNLKGLSIALSNVGNIQNLIGNTDTALDYALQSLEIAKVANNKGSVAYCYRLLGRIYRKQGKYDEALDMYQNATMIYRELLAKRNLGETQVSIGNIYFEKRNFKEALKFYKEAIIVFRVIGDSSQLSYSYAAVAAALTQTRQFNTAKKYLDSTIDFATKKKIPNLRMDSYELFSNIYEQEGNYKLSQNYYKKFVTLRDSVEAVQDKQASQEIEARYQSEKKDDAIRLLNTENELKETLIRTKNNERNYLLIFLTLSVALVAIVYNRYKVKLKANEKLKELDQIKSRFFTNVSHEFRTPLSLILGPLEEKLSKTNEESEKEELVLMHRNAKRLQNLINEVLDLSRLEAGSMELHLQEGELASVIKFIGSTFSSMAERKGLTFTQEIFDPPYNGCYDRDKLEKMLNNLLSNAFKFTPEGGSVNMKADVTEGKLIIGIKDTGVGIPQDKLELIFNRFYQVDDSLTRSSEGSGIGLALTRELAELHGGKLTVSSVEGKGSTFTLTLPVAREAFGALKIAAAIPLEEKIFDSPILTNDIASVEDDETKPLILIAEDNLDMQKFIADLLKEKYRIICAGNGKEAYERAKTIVPDLIISDWMMPIMDGRACCEKLKTTDATSHIPVLMLTARADQSSKLEGLETGADDYLIKPFNKLELTIRIHNLIEQRRKLRAIFSKELVLQPKQISLPSRDASFLTNLLSLLENKFSDPNLSVDSLAEEVNMSRMQLHRKLKALTDQSPGEFLRRFRLERAKQLLSIEGTQVSEVCFKVGFNNVSHFSKAFHDFAGVTPSEFIETSTIKNGTIPNPISTVTD
jgi:signal transduction histidine kinase/DNA-binding response OmpR family regulator